MSGNGAESRRSFMVKDTHGRRSGWFAIFHGNHAVVYVNPANRITAGRIAGGNLIDDRKFGRWNVAVIELVIQILADAAELIQPGHSVSL